MSIKKEHLIPVEGILKAGQRLVKIGETFVPIGFGGNFEPGSVIYMEEGRDTYYKCASVSETTWDGYALVLGADGYYTISETLTTGLAYGIGYTPKVDGVYNANATISVGKYNKLVVIPEEGLLFHLPLTDDLNSVVGNSVSVIAGTPTVTTYKGLACTRFAKGGDRLQGSGEGLPSGASARSVSFWMNSQNTGRDGYMFAYGKASSNQYFGASNYYTAVRFAANSNSNPLQCPITADVWTHIVGTYDGANLSIYANGVLFGTKPFPTASLNTANDYIDVGGNGSYNFDGYLAGCRIYDRVLTEDEIVALSEEFTPTA